MNLSHILSMGGYGFYVWPAYAITLGVFGFNWWLFLREKNTLRK